MKLKIKEVRKRIGVTQIQLAKMIKVYQVDISEWENTTRMPSIKNLTEIANALNVTLEDLVEYHEAQDKISEEYIKIINEEKESV